MIAWKSAIVDHNCQSYTKDPRNGIIKAKAPETKATALEAKAKTPEALSWQNYHRTFQLTTTDLAVEEDTAARRLAWSPGDAANSTVSLFC